MQSGRDRGRPRGPCNGGMASSSGNAWVESWQFRAGQFDCQWNATPVTDQMALAAPFSSIGRIRPSLQPPKRLAPSNYQQPHGTSRFGHHEKANAATRSESGPQFPACCRSRKRRQQVMPEPQPICAGSIRQGMPLRSTNRIPVRQARSDTRGRPPCGFGIEAGRSGRIKLHRASGTSAAAITIPPSREGQTLGLYKGKFCESKILGFSTAQTMDVCGQVSSVRTAAECANRIIGDASQRSLD
jgi:hypothetical protein